MMAIWICLILTLAVFAPQNLWADYEDGVQAEAREMISAPLATKHILEHKAAVVEMGFFIFQHFSSDFPQLAALEPHERKRVIFEHLKLHDNPKLWSYEELRIYGYKQSISIFDYIRRYWGTSIPLTDRQWIDELNRIEGENKQTLSRQNLQGYSARQADKIYAELLFLEDLADMLHTKIHRAKTGELGPHLKNEAAFAFARYLRDVRKFVNWTGKAVRLEILWSQHKSLCFGVFFPKPNL